MLAEIIALTLICIAIWVAISIISFVVDCIVEADFVVFFATSILGAGLIAVLWLIWVALTLLGG